MTSTTTKRPIEITPMVEPAVEAVAPVEASALAQGQPSRLFNRHFLLLWQGQAVSQLGSQVYSIAIVFWIKHATESASLIGLIMMLSSIPGVILGGVAGTMVDRHSRRKIILFSDLFRGIVVLSLAAMLYWMPDATETIIAWIFVVALCMSVTGSFFGPAMSASIPDLVPEDRLAGANSLRQLTAQLALFFGRGLGGMLYRLMGGPLLVLLNGVSFLFSAASEYFVRIPQEIPEKSGGWRAEFAAVRTNLAEGLRYVWDISGLRKLFFFSAIFNFFTMPVIVLLPFYVEDYLRLPLDWYGYLLAVYGSGVLVGALLVGWLKLPGRGRGRLMIVFAFFNSAIVALLGYAQDPFTAMALALLLGLMGAFNGIHVSTIIQMSTPRAMRGRVFGLMHTLSGSLAPLGMGLGGIVFDMTGQNIPLIFVSCGAVMVLLSALVSLNRDFRDFLAYERKEDEDAKSVQS